MISKIAILLIFIFSFTNVVISQSFKTKLIKKKDFFQLKGKPLTHKYNQIYAVKVIYDLKKKELFFINSKDYKYHFDFCTSNLGYEYGLNYFNQTNYTDSNNKKFLLGNLNYIRSSQKFVFEISPSDLMPFDEIVMFYKSIIESILFNDNISFLLNNPRLIKSKDRFKRIINVVEPSDIYKDLNYQMISRNEAFGMLKFFKDYNFQDDKVKESDIIVLNKTPLFLPKVGGVIISEFQTPLSHLSILGKNRKIPICAYKIAFSDTNLLKYEGEIISFAVSDDNFKVKKSFKLPEKRKYKKVRLKYDLEVDSIIPIENINRKYAKIVGNKAANFSELKRISSGRSFKVPECQYAIPFYFYNCHMLKNGIYNLIDSLLRNEIKGDNEQLSSRLDQIREKIISSEIDSNLIKRLNEHVRENGKYKRIRFRSSTNAEDLRGFSGAGLYTSKTGILDDSNKSFGLAIKKVWASLWSLEAYLERNYYNINHRDVYMGILVHRSFPNERVNGVAITKNLYRADNKGFVVNAQIGNESVVKPSEGVISDQFICYPESKNLYNNRIDIITTSNINNGNMVMSESEIYQLAKELDYIKSHFMRITSTLKTYEQFGLDIEFKLDANDNQLYIKQVRPYLD